MTDKLHWRAGTDQIDHAYRKGELRTLCGLRIIEERRSWPPTIKCHECIAIGQRPVGRGVGT
jgi:hypothetical protein